MTLRWSTDFSRFPAKEPAKTGTPTLGCPHLLAEAELYCYSTEAGRGGGKVPEDDNNHALGALRYLIAKLDARKLGRNPKLPSMPPQPESAEKPKEKKWLSLKNEALWAQMWTVDG